MNNIQVYNLLKLTYGFDSNEIYKNDFINTEYNIENSFKRFKKMLDYFELNLTKQMIESIFTLEIDLQNPILWDSILFSFKNKIEDRELIEYQKDLKYILGMVYDSGNFFDLDFNYINELINNMLTLFIFDKFNINNDKAFKYFKDFDYIESLILKDNRLYYVSEIGLHKWINKSNSRDILVSDDKKSWKEIYSIINIENCDIMCDIIR